MGNRICVGQESRQPSSSKKYKEEPNLENVLEERNTDTLSTGSNISERFLQHLIKAGAMDDLDSVFMVP